MSGQGGMAGRGRGIRESVVNGDAMAMMMERND